MPVNEGSLLLLILGHLSVGFTGGFGHCVLMCHPFVLHISSLYADKAPGYKILIPNLFYNIGRTITYTFVGAVIGGLGSLAASIFKNDSFVFFQKTVSIAGGAILILFSLLYVLNISSLNFAKKLPIVSNIKKLSPSNPLLYGIILGFLPCGLSMYAFFAVIPSGSWYAGALMMAAFGIGTSAAMMVLAVLGSYITKYVKVFKYITSLILFAMGIYFIYQGIKFSY